MSVDYSDLPGWPAEPTRVYADATPWLDEQWHANARALTAKRRARKNATRAKWRAANRERVRAQNNAYRRANLAEYNAKKRAAWKARQVAP